MQSCDVKQPWCFWRSDLMDTFCIRLLPEHLPSEEDIQDILDDHLRSKGETWEPISEKDLSDLKKGILRFLQDTELYLSPSYAEHMVSILHERI